MYYWIWIICSADKKPLITLICKPSTKFCFDSQEMLDSIFIHLASILWKVTVVCSSRLHVSLLEHRSLPCSSICTIHCVLCVYRHPWCNSQTVMLRTLRTAQPMCLLQMTLALPRMHQSLLVHLLSAICWWIYQVSLLWFLIFFLYISTCDAYFVLVFFYDYLWYSCVILELKWLFKLVAWPTTWVSF